MTEIHWSSQALYPILGILQLLPLLGALALHLMRGRPGSIPLGRLCVAIELVVAIELYMRYNETLTGFQFAEKFSLLGPLGYHAAADGVTVLFILLTALVMLLLTIYSLVRGLPEPDQVLKILLLVEGVLMSLLATVNLLWFSLASAVEIGLVGYLMWRWATSPEKDLAMARFFQFQGTGLLLLLVGTFVVGWNHADAAGRWSFDLYELAGTPVARPFASVVFFLLFYGLAVRTPLFPMHGWLPTVAHFGNVAIAPSILLGIKVGIYGMVRFVFPIVPEAVTQWHNFIAAIAAVGVFYAAFLAFMQTTLRRLLAFAVVSHTSLLVIGLFTLHPDAFQGSVLLAVNFGLAATTLLFMVGFVYNRLHTTALEKLGGLFDRIPVIGLTFFAGGLSIIGMPGTPGFDAAHLVMEAALERFGALPTVAVALGNVVAAGFLLYAFQRVFLAPRPENEAPRHIEREQPMEYFVAGTVLVILLATGFYLEPWQKLIEVSLHTLSLRFGH